MNYNFASVARLPSPDDNVAIATQTLEGGTHIRYNGAQFQLSHTILEGHRFAIQSISESKHRCCLGAYLSVLPHVPLPPAIMSVIRR